MAKFKAYKWKATEDSEGEIKLVLIISKTEASKVKDVPVETILDVEIISE